MHLLTGDGTVINTFEINGLTDSEVNHDSNASDFYGTDVAGVGDIDGDGVEDIIVGAYADDRALSSR